MGKSVMLFSEQIDKIKRVFDSCETINQLENANVWSHMFKRKYQPLQSSDFYLPTIKREIIQRYIKRRYIEGLESLK